MRHKALIALAITGILALSACSGDDGDDAAAAAAPAATTNTSVSAQPSAGGARTIADVALATPNLSTLTAAVGAAGLTETLKGPGPFTVFAPTDDAFAALPAGVVDRLVLPCNKDALTSVLTYHVLPAQVRSADIAPGPATTVEGSDVTLAVDGGNVTVDEVGVVAADVEASNGVVHVVDGVLLPRTFDPASLKAAC